MKFIVDKAETRGYFDHGWLKTFHIGALRVLNDDTVAPGEGFGMHPHNNMEVVSIPLQGYLRHGDSVKNESTITPGEIQVMSTGTGMFHSEYNASMSEVLKFLQIWIVPKVKNTKPEYHNYDIRPLLKHNELCTWFSMGTFDAGRHVTYRMNKKNTGVYIFVLEGNIDVQGKTLSRRDAIGVWDVEQVEIQSVSNSSILLIEVPVA